ncbi:hypothetical protein CP979_00505 [Streptomyces filamentosus]|nr:hypothetical protein CP979_00505 [Streptomyces filamentosus]
MRSFVEDESYEVRVGPAGGLQDSEFGDPLPYAGEDDVGHGQGAGEGGAGGGVDAPVAQDDGVAQGRAHDVAGMSR